MSKLLPYLVEIQEKHLPLLEHDLQHASTLYTLQAALKSLHQIVTYVVAAIVEDGYDAAKARAARLGPPASAPATQVPMPTVPRQAVATRPYVPTAPPLNSGGLPPLPGLNTGVTAEQSKVVDVTITPSGTQVKIPGGPTLQLPPGEQVILPDSSGPVLEGPEDVVLPPGGGMGPAAAAALAAATGARNITHDPPPQE